MRLRGQPRGQECQLQLVQETSLELTFQLGVQSKSAALKGARISSCINLVIAVLVIGFIYVLRRNMANDPNIPNIPSRTSFISYILAMGTVIPSFMLISSSYQKYFTVWTFNRTGQQIIKTTSYLFRKEHTDIFPVSEVQSILVEQDHDAPYASTELYMVLKSGKQITLSQSSYSDETSQQASDLKYHEEIAQKMRNYLGW